MRRIFGNILFVFLAVALCSCAGTGVSVLSYEDELCAATVTFGKEGTEYSAEVTLIGELDDDTSRYRRSKIELTSPEDIAGITVEFSDDAASLICKTASFELAAGAGDSIYRIVRALSLREEELVGAGDIANSEAGSFRFEANTLGQSLTYDIAFDGSGLPRTAKIDGGGSTLCVNFESLRMNSSESREQTE